MRISPVANFNIGSSSIYVSQKYNSAAINRIGQVEGNNYSYRRSIEKKFSSDNLSKMMHASATVNVRLKIIVLTDGKLFVGTLIDITV